MPIFLPQHNKSCIYVHYVLTYKFDDSGVDEVVHDDFAQFWKVPAIPLSHTHDVVIQLFVKVIE